MCNYYVTLIHSSHIPIFYWKSIQCDFDVVSFWDFYDIGTVQIVPVGRVAWRPVWSTCRSVAHLTTGDARGKRQLDVRNDGTDRWPCVIGTCIWVRIIIKIVRIGSESLMCWNSQNLISNFITNLYYCTSIHYCSFLSRVSQYDFACLPWSWNYYLHL